MRKFATGQALLKQAKDLGIDIEAEWDGEASIQPSDAQVQARILAFEAHKRQDRVALAAIISAVAAVLSSAVALVALLHK